MAITHMEAVTIVGAIDEFDDIVDKYVYGRDIHIESTMSVIKEKRRLFRFEESDEYDVLAKNAQGILKLADYSVIGKSTDTKYKSPEEMNGYLDRINHRIENERREGERLDAEIKKNDEIIAKMERIEHIDIDMSKLFSLEFIKFKFGHLPKSGYKTLKTFLNDIEIIFVKTGEDENDVWGFYFASNLNMRKANEIFSSLYFREEILPKGYSGTPAEIRKGLEEQNEEMQRQKTEISKDTAKMLSNSREELEKIYNLAKKRSQFAEIRAKAAHSNLFFYIIGWMEPKHAKALEDDINKSSDVVMISREKAGAVADRIQPPTKLKNNFVFKPFEMFVKMYGLPSYNEIDPTPILAVTYILFFGIMFGDVGQAAVLSIAGFLLYKFKKMDLAGIIGFVGLSGIVFGFVYGSFFGNEEIIPKIFGTTPLQPLEQAITMLIATIAIGAVVILFGMVLNVINMAKKKDTGKMLFGHNGLAGIVFYASFIGIVLNMVLKLGIPSVIFAVLMIVSAITMYMCEPLGKCIRGEKHWLPKKGMFYVEQFFELFEVILSFFTNTLSFLRIGAFAVVHVGMMIVVSVLSRGGGVGGIIVMIIGNIIVMGLEGLIVGIQVLRLEYYEMFSRYFTGAGKEFVSLKDK